MIKSTPVKPKKKKFQLIGESFEKELVDIIDSRIRDFEESISKEEITIIIKSLFPDINKMISDNVKKHMRFLGEKLIEVSEQE